jgi:CRP/FNR family transcriptional regulator
MAKVIDQDCRDCIKLESCCCKNCFENEESYIFEPLSKSELHFLVGEKQQIVYNPGETIIKQNTSSTSVVCIKEGLAKVYVESGNNKKVIVDLVGRGDFITGGGLFNGNIQHFSISALTQVTCCFINSSKITKIVSENSQFAVRLLHNHTKQNNFLLEKLVNHTQKYMPGRVADTLLYLKNKTYNENPFSTSLTRQDLADMSNMTKESFVRILHEFKSSNLIKVQGSNIEILDEKSLNSISKNG